jgi:hypothetical protein
MTAYSAAAVGAIAEGADDAPLTVDYPSAVAPGAYLVLYSSTRSQVPVPVPEGWVRISATDQGTTKLQAFGREANGREGASMILPGLGSGDKWMAQIAAFITGMRDYKVRVEYSIAPASLAVDDILTPDLPAGSVNRLVIYLGAKDANVAPFDTMPNSSTLLGAKSSSSGNAFTFVWSYEVLGSAGISSSAFDSSTVSTASERTNIIILLQPEPVALGGRIKRELAEIDGQLYEIRNRYELEQLVADAREAKRRAYVASFEDTAEEFTTFRPQVPMERTVIPREGRPRTVVLPTTNTGLRRLARKPS